VNYSLRISLESFDYSGSIANMIVVVEALLPDLKQLSSLRQL